MPAFENHYLHVKPRVQPAKGTGLQPLAVNQLANCTACLESERLDPDTSGVRALPFQESPRAVQLSGPLLRDSMGENLVQPTGRGEEP